MTGAALEGGDLVCGPGGEDDEIAHAARDWFAVVVVSVERNVTANVIVWLRKLHDKCEFSVRFLGG